MQRSIESRNSGRRRILLVRHGEVNYFSHSGEMDPDPPLTTNGHAQVAATASFLRANGVHVDRLISSELRRSRETAHLLAGSFDAPVTSFSSLNEIRGGDVRGLAPEPLAQAFFSGVRLVPESWAFMRGETVREFTSRINATIEELRTDDTWNCALLAVHGGVNTAILSRALSGSRNAYFASIEQDYACLNVLDVGATSDDWVVRLMNFAAHRPVDSTPTPTTLERLLSRHLE